MKKLLLLVIVLLPVFNVMAQDDEDEDGSKPKKTFVPESTNMFQLGFSVYDLKRSGYHEGRKNVFSNKGLLLSYENRTDLKRWLYISNTVELDLWNHTVRGFFYDRISGVTDTAQKYVHSLTNFGVSYKPALCFPITIKEVRCFVGIGAKYKAMLSTRGKVFVENVKVGTTTGYTIDRRFSSSLFDYFFLAFEHADVKNFEIKLEGEHLGNVLLRRLDWNYWHSGYFYRATDGKYNYYNLNLKLCYKI